MTIFEAGRRPRGIVPRRDRSICCAMLSSAHQRLEALISQTEEVVVRMGGGFGARSGLVGSIRAEGSWMWPKRLLARISEVTPSSQAKKSSFEVRMVICVTVGNVLEEVAGAGEEEGKGVCTGAV